MSKKNPLILEAYDVETYQTTEYVNVSKTLEGYPELLTMASNYFRGTTAPHIPNVNGMVVYAWDYQRFVRWLNWKLAGNITNLSDIGADQNDAQNLFLRN